MIKNSIKQIIERVPYVAQLYRNCRDHLDRNHTSIQTPWGFKFSGNDSMAKGMFEPEETEIVRKLLSEVDVLVNIGANVGYYCCHALSLGKPVIAVEPIARNLHYLMRNIRENGWSENVQIFPVALSSKASIMKMYGGGTGASLIKGWAGIPDSYVTQVPVLTLDCILLGNTLLDGKKVLMLVDIEGAEYSMLQGAEHCLCLVPRPIWMVEIGSTTHQPDGVNMNPYLAPTFEMFFQKGYVASTSNLAQDLVDSKYARDVANGNAKFSTHNFLFR
ncbi:MAG: FkbM family methyltransferase [Magnetococcales bacterium]|nr:FkbM family methyltransferase [Magnetococcales bacterium]